MATTPLTDDVAAKLPPAVVDWIRGGGLVRSSLEDPLPGRCGGPLQKSDGGFCTAAAGRGTDHLGLARCSHHEDLPLSEGLPIWYGNVPNELWYAITGRSDHDGVNFQASVTHGATDFALTPFEQLVQKSLKDPEDLEAFRTASVDPSEVIDTQLRIRQMAQVKIIRHYQTRAMQRLQSGKTTGKTASLELYAMESLLNKSAQTIARLLETKAKYLELQQTERRDDDLRSLLASMTEDEVLAVRKSPEFLAKFIPSVIPTP